MDFAAIFDWDGVIIDSSAQHECSWELLATEINKALPEGHFKRGFGKKNAEIIPDLGWATNPAEVQALGDRKEELYRELVRRDGITPLPGAKELLEALNAAGIPCAVGSSTPRVNIETICGMTGLGRHFRAVVTAEDVKHGKPAPDVFLTAAKRLGAEPARCVVFEDALVGIEAAHAGGMKCVAVATTNPIELLGHAEIAVERLTGVSLAMLAGLFVR
jgi:beta-phosphoglucomutase family hydrolase